MEFTEEGEVIIIEAVEEELKLQETRPKKWYRVKQFPKYVLRRLSFL